ncbi:3825_t:CDS:2, partial [Ambispora leptoticha]
NVDAHGRLTVPPIRLAPNDADSDYTIARSPTKGPPCGMLDRSAGPVTTYNSGANVPFTWQITAAHLGTCYLEFSPGNDANWQVLDTNPHCADTNGIFSGNAQLPAGTTCDACTLRWRWEAHNTGEEYINCANIQIGGSSAQNQPNPSNTTSATSPSTTPTSTISTSTNPTSTMSASFKANSSITTSATSTTTKAAQSSVSGDMTTEPTQPPAMTTQPTQSASSAMTTEPTSSMTTEPTSSMTAKSSAANSGEPTSTKSAPTAGISSLPPAMTSGIPQKPHGKPNCVQHKGATYCRKNHGCSRKNPQACMKKDGVTFCMKGCDKGSKH